MTDCNQQDPINNTIDDPCNLLALLPASLLLSHLFPLLGPAELVRLGSCCRALHAAAFSDDVWKPLCEALGWGAFPRGTSWQAGFSSQRRMLCVECGDTSRYVFALLRCRLCEKCEHRSPRYGLVTALEAAERYGVPYTMLAALSYHDTCGTRFYLRSAVEAMSRSGSSSGRNAVAPLTSSSDDEDGDVAQGEEAGEEAKDVICEDNDGHKDVEEEGDGAGNQAGLQGASAAARRVEEKAARKAAKKATKEAQRLKRQLRKNQQGGGSGACSEAPRQQHQQPVGSAHRGSNRPRGGRVAAAAAAIGSSPPPGCRAAGPLIVIQDDDGDGSALPLEGQSVLLPQSRGRGGGGRGSGGSVSGKGNAGGSGGGGGVTRTVKLKSGWAAERETLMAAWGQFGISGLVLAS